MKMLLAVLAAGMLLCGCEAGFPETTSRWNQKEEKPEVVVVQPAPPKPVVVVTEVEVTNQQIVAENKELKAENKGLKEKLLETDLKFKAASGLVKEKDRTIDELRQQRDDLEKEKGRIANDLAAAKVLSVTLQKDLAKVREENKEHWDKVGKHVEEVAALRARIAQAKVQQEVDQKKIEELNKKIETQSEKIRELEKRPQTQSVVPQPVAPATVVVSGSSGLPLWFVVLISVSLLALMVAFIWVWQKADKAQELAEKGPASMESLDDFVRNSKLEIEKAAREAEETINAAAGKGLEVGERAANDAEDLSRKVNTAGTAALMAMQDQQGRFISALEEKALRIKEEADRLEKIGQSAKSFVDTSVASIEVRLSEARQKLDKKLVEAREEVDEVAKQLESNKVLAAIEEVGKSVREGLDKLYKDKDNELTQMVRNAEVAAARAEKAAEAVGVRFNGGGSHNPSDSSAVIESIAAKETAALKTVNEAVELAKREVASLGVGIKKHLEEEAVLAKDELHRLSESLKEDARQTYVELEGTTPAEPAPASEAAPISADFQKALEDMRTELAAKDKLVEYVSQVSSELYLEVKLMRGQFINLKRSVTGNLLGFKKFLDFPKTGFKQRIQRTLDNRLSEFKDIRDGLVRRMRRVSLPVQAK